MMHNSFLIQIDGTQMWYAHSNTTVPYADVYTFMLMKEKPHVLKFLFNIVFSLYF